LVSAGQYYIRRGNEESMFKSSLWYFPEEVLFSFKALHVLNLEVTGKRKK